MLFRKIVSFIMIVLFVSSTTCHLHAQDLDASRFPVPEKIEGEADVGEAISPLKLGQRAPFTGVLLSPAAVAKMLVELKSIDDKIKIETERATKICEAQCEFRVKETKIELETDKKILIEQLKFQKEQNKILEDRVQKYESKQQPVALWAIGGFGLGLATTILIVFATSSIVKGGT